MKDIFETDKEFRQKAKSLLINYNLYSPWYDWLDYNEKMPTELEVVCRSISNDYGKIIYAKQWLIIPPPVPTIYGGRETLVAETYIKNHNKYSHRDYVVLWFGHLSPFGF